MAVSETAVRPLALLKQKRGPLPVWAWLGIGLGLLLVVLWWRRQKSSAAAAEAATGDGTIPSNQGAPAIFVVPPAAVPAVNITAPITLPTAPPAGSAPPPTGTSSGPATVGAPGPTTNLYEWVKTLNAQGRSPYSFVQLFGDANGNGAINVGYRKYMKWRTGAGGPYPYFDPNWSGRNPALGIPPVRIR